MKSILSAVIGATLALSAIEAVAQATPGERQVSLTIDTGTLASALDKWAQQSGFQIFVQDWEATKNLRAPSLNGTFAAQDALEQLLSGTSLTYVWIDSKTVSIRKKAAKTVPTALQRTSLEGQQAIPVAKFTGDDVGAGAASASSPSGSEPGLRMERLEEMIVTGTYIRGLPPQSAPLTTYSREDIQLSGVSSLDQFARERMPQNFASVDAASAVGTSAGGFTQNGNNRAQGAAFNLHGLGPGATLTLVNGQRLSAAGGSGEFVDISLIPLSAVERIEVLTDGASALYGADAVAGVVNIILRDDFDGAETALKYGEASEEGANEFSASQLFGHAWSTGNAMLLYEYSKHDKLLATDRSFIPPQTGPYTILPEQEQNSVLVNARQEAGDSTTVSAGVMFSERATHLVTTPVGAPFSISVDSKARQYGANIGVTRRIGSDWQAMLLANYSTTEQPEAGVLPSFLNPGATQVQRIDVDTQRSAVELRADGSAFQMPAGAAKLAVGGSFAREDLDDRSSLFDDGVPMGSTSAALERKIASVYGELFLPLVGRENGGSQRLEASLAGRYDHYDDFGSSTNPKIGVLWSPLAGINLRGTWGKSFRPPLLPDLIDRPSYFNFDLPDAAAADGVTTTLANLSAGNPALNAERSESFTAGIDWQPTAVPRLQLSLTYFDVDFEERVARPPILGSIFDIYGQLDTLAPFFDFAPDPAEIARLFESGVVQDTTLRGPESVEAIFDNRPRNIAMVQQTGLDFNAAYQWPTRAGEFSVSLGASHLLKNEYRAVQTTPVVSLIDLIGQPVDTRVNGSVAWSRGGFQTGVAVNYWGGYSDTLATPTARVDSWTTADLLLSYRTGESQTARFASGFNLALSVRNLTNETPPFVRTTIGYDAMNASPVGRFVTLSVTKSW
jgi:iron complex outermembrane recepter protein